ncbi:MAG: carboxypeptidase-like regulatory domain-containing protein, partial [Thermoplasmata archaeon]|nr:carboxypeptidase-like regulatory domain-containing protein [Thermoplasmata archaeon]
MVGGPLVTIRCVRCGRLLVAPVPPGAEPVWFACPHCSQPVPLVPPRDPPPLFSWEVYPHLYPPARPPKVPGPAVGRLLVALLVTAVVVLVGLAGALSWAGVSSLGPGGFTVEGVVTISNGGGVSVPSVNTLVNLTSETGEVRTVATGSDGSFSFADIPAGGIVLNVTASGYGPVLVQLFASSVYSSIGVGQAVDIALSPGSVSNVTYLS